MAIKAKSQLAISHLNQQVLCYIDLDVNNNYGIFLIHSEDCGVTWSVPVTIKTGVSITSFKAKFDVVNRLNIYYSKIVAGVIKLYYVTTNDLGVTLSAEVEVV